jgi:hypothetical protein
MQALVLVVAALSFVELGCSRTVSPAVVDAGAPVESSSPGASAAASASAPTPSATADASVVAQLAPADVTFVDARHGFGWGDRCFAHYRAGELPQARAACDHGLALPDLDPGARPMLLYNEGLVAEKAGDLAAARTDYAQSLAARPAGEEGRAVVEKALVALGGMPPAPPAIRAPLECRAKGADGTVELFLDWNQNLATGWMRTVRATGSVVTRAVDAELYKGLVLVNPAGAPDPRSRIATEQTLPGKSLQVGDDKQPWLPCAAVSATPPPAATCSPGSIDSCGDCYEPCGTDADCKGKGTCQPIVCTHTAYGNGCVTP